ncbi:hypothetical protein B0I29_12379 [Actinoplanes lutulentus]|uniref:Uncharacterized protein n=1 Tax=Actinoplanes lutulentus TaxID=1287878 RepID=A0A327Z362_9ACTN|nr:DUF6529 family protein [Actinoplanes lutulentus]RAK27445.1 hypothetical protein B0I29_12379 [Actinoplanes lutulentus]
MRAGTLRRPHVWLPVVAGVGVAVALGVYGRLHDPAGTSGIGDALRLQSGKVWLATAVLLFAVVQLISALSMYGALPSAPWIATVHRWSGRVAVLLSLPIAVHCLYALGFSSASLRVLVHSVLGCVFYGAFVTKMLLISRPGDTRAWVLPLVGGLLLTAITGLWLTSSLWFFATVGF